VWACRFGAGQRQARYQPECQVRRQGFVKIVQQSVQEPREQACREREPPNGELSRRVQRACVPLEEPTEARMKEAPGQPQVQAKARQPRVSQPFEIQTVGMTP